MQIDFQITVEIHAGILEQVEDQFEAVGSHVVGVGNVVYGMSAEICGHFFDFTGCLDGRSHVHQAGKVVVIHGDDDIEIEKVGHVYRPGTVG